eukprot:jgi/Hompol1/5434/HPOL_004444-RA
MADGSGDDSSLIGELSNILLILLGLASLFYFALVGILRMARRDAARKVDEASLLVADTLALFRWSRWTMLDFPWLSHAGWRLAMLKAIVVPAVAQPLAASGQLEHNCPALFDAADLLLREVWEHPLSSDRAKLALRRIVHLIAVLKLRNAELKYILSVLCIEPVLLIRRFGFRMLVDSEVRAYFLSWRNIGMQLGIRDVSQSFEDMQEFVEVGAHLTNHAQFLHADENPVLHMRYTESSQAVATPALNLCFSTTPPFWRPLATQAVISLMSVRLRRAIGLGDPFPGAYVLTTIAMLSQAFVVRFCMLPREKAHYRTPQRSEDGAGRYVPEFDPYESTYQDGYYVTRLGPPQYADDRGLGVLQLIGNEDNNKS